MLRQIADYDSNDYDYRTYWNGREYERWAEEQALGRLVPQLAAADWLVDFGGGYGRNARHYRHLTRHYVIADGSATNLRNAAVDLRADVAAGRAFLVRCDLGALPFTAYAFDAALVVRVLHHLADIDGALAQMAATVGGRFLLDVPIKHHALALARDWRAVRGPGPLRTGSTGYPFWNFRLSTIRNTLARLGFASRPVASVNNLRRWDRHLPGGAVRVLGPAVRAAELAVQRAGRGWFGPSQFLMAQRIPARQPMVREVPPGIPALAARMCCPACRGRLAWSTGVATCLSCEADYRWGGPVWDFTIPC
jgi:SAM-dependent methyltransferase